MDSLSALVCRGSEFSSPWEPHILWTPLSNVEFDCKGKIHGTELVLWLWKVIYNFFEERRNLEVIYKMEYKVVCIFSHLIPLCCGSNLFSFSIFIALSVMIFYWLNSFSFLSLWILVPNPILNSICNYSSVYALVLRKRKKKKIHIGSALTHFTTLNLQDSYNIDPIIVRLCSLSNVNITWPISGRSWVRRWNKNALAAFNDHFSYSHCVFSSYNMVWVVRLYISFPCTPPPPPPRIFPFHKNIL